MRKQLEDITKEDLEEYPVWYFVSEDDEDSDEMTIEPASVIHIKGEYEVIVKASFTDKMNRQYLGYIYWQVPFSLDAIQPVIICDDNTKVLFWHGMCLPDKKLRRLFRKDSFPISFQSTDAFGLKIVTGVLKGFYYINNSDEICVI